MLAHEPVTAAEKRRHDSPGHGSEDHHARHAWFLHGIYGSRQNWRGVARRLADRRPDWIATLVDLRMHGESQGFPPPHDLEACAADLARLAERLGEPPRALVGHSFGGKVALRYAARRAPGLRQLWIVDASPSSGSPHGEVYGILDHLRALPGPFTARSEAVRALVARGVSEPVGRWLSMNLEKEENGRYGWRLDLAALETLLRDYHAADLWAIVSSPPPGCEIRFVKATRSAALSEEECGRIESLASAGAPLRLHRVEGGHWLNAEAPDELASLLSDGLS